MVPRLVEAAFNGNTIELQRLLGEDSLLLERDSLAVYPETALHIATMGGQTEFVWDLLKLKPDLATRLDKDGFSAIHIASPKGFVETVRELLKFSRELAHLKSSDGRTCLHCAAVTGRVHIFRQLVGFSPDCIGDVTLRGETALHLAVKYNQFEAFKAMVDLSMQLNMQEILNAGDEDGNTVLHLGIAWKQSQLVDSIKGMDPRLLEAALNGNTIELQRLLGEDSLLLERDSLAVYPETVLHIATMGGQTEFVRELLKLKPDLATRLDKDGFSAIHIASAKGFVETVRELLKFSSELALLNSSDGRTSLHCAAVTGRVQVIRELVGFFPDCIGDVTLRGETALHLAVKYNQFEAFKAMFEMLKQLNMQEIMSAGDEDGNTVLHLAVARKQSQTVKLLLGRQEEAVDVNVTNKSGFTALDVSDVIQQMGVSEPADFILRDVPLRAGALRASELEDVHAAQVHRKQISVTAPTAPLPPQTLWPFLLHEISLLNPWRFWKLLAKEVKKSPPETQNALLVVAVLIATITYQAILNPPGGTYNGDGYNAAAISLHLQEFLSFMVPNSIGFFASLAVIILVIDGFPLKALLGVAVRCLAANYLCGLLLIGPIIASFKTSDWGMTVIGIIVLVDLIRFVYWLVKRWSKEYIRNRRTF